jgi:hypothetical protein
MSFSPIQPEDLISPKDMLPALALKADAPKVSSDLCVPLRPFEDDLGAGQVMLIQIPMQDRREVQVALMSYEGDPGFVHLFVGDEHIEGDPVRSLRTIVNALHLDGYEIGWWTRQSDAKWPGNSVRDFA